MLLGIFIYVAGIPIVEELATVIIQGLEIIRGKFILIITNLQSQQAQLEDKNTEISNIHAIGFAIPTIDDDDEEDYENDD